MAYPFLCKKRCSLALTNTKDTPLYSILNPPLSVIPPTNLAEGNSRFTKADRRNFFTIARGSAQECVPLIEIARRRGFIDMPVHTDLRTRLEEIAKMLSGLINGLEKREV